MVEGFIILLLHKGRSLVMQEVEILSFPQRESSSALEHLRKKEVGGSNPSFPTMLKWPSGKAPIRNIGEQWFESILELKRESL